MLPETAATPAITPNPAPLHVWLLDSFCFTPWYTAALASALAANGAALRLVCGPFPREPAYFRSLGLHPDPGPVRISAALAAWPAPLHRGVRTAEAMLNLRALARSLSSSGNNARPDVLHLQQLPMLDHGLRSDFLLIDAARQAQVPVVHTVHNLLPHDSGERLRDTYAELYARVDHLICHSAGTAGRLASEFSTPRQKISVIPHGPLFAPAHAPAASEAAAARKRLGLAADPRRPLVLWQGVLAPYKGLDVLLDAWQLCAAACQRAGAPAPLLLIAGDGPRALKAAARRAAALSGGTVRVDLGYIATARLPDYYTAADVLVYPYRAITTSGALLTGLAYAKPIVASRLAPFAEYLVDNENARLVEPGDSRALADALTGLLLNLLPDLLPDLAGPRQTNAASPGSYARLAAGAARNRTRYCGWPAIARGTLALYRRLAPTAALPPP